MWGRMKWRRFFHRPPSVSAAMLPTMAQSIASAFSCSQVSTCSWLWAGRHEGWGQKPVGHISGSTHMSLP